MSRPGYPLAMKSPISLIVTIAIGATETFAAGTFKIKMPCRAKVIGIDTAVGAKGGTHSVSTIDVKAGATSLLAAVFDVAAMSAGTPVAKEGTALSSAADAVAKDAEISIILAESGGSSPTFGRATVQIDVVPLGD